MVPITDEIAQEIAKINPNSEVEVVNAGGIIGDAILVTPKEPPQWPIDTERQKEWVSTRRRVTLYLPHAWSALLRQVAYAKEQSLVAWAQEHVIEDAKALNLALPTEENRTKPLPLE